MASAASPPLSPSSRQPETPSAAFFDLVDLDFSDPPAPHSPSDEIPRSPPTSNGTTSRWAPMVPDAKVVTPTISVTPLEGESDEDEADHGSINGKGAAEGDSIPNNAAAIKEADMTDSSNSSAGAESKGPAEGDKVEVLADGGPASAKEVVPAPASDSGDSASSQLRPVATPFTSKALRVAPASAPHSFFPGRADTASHAASVPASPHLPNGAADHQKSGTTGFFYGESDGYAMDGSVKVPPAPWAASPPTHPGGLSPVAAAAFRPPPETKAIRISSPQQSSSQAREATPPRQASQLTPSSTAPVFTPRNQSISELPKNIPLPKSEAPKPVPLPKPDSIPTTEPPSKVASSDPVSGDDKSAVEAVDAPVNGLIRSLSNFSLKEADKAEEEPTPISPDLPAPTSPKTSQKPSSNRWADSPSIPVVRTPAADNLIPSKAAQQTLADLMESQEELDELDQQWKDYRDAYGKFSGGLEEVIARLRYNLEEHSCTPTDNKDDLRAARQQIHTLQTEIQDLKSARVTKEREQKTKADDLAKLQRQLSEQIEKCDLLEEAAAKAKVTEADAWAKLEALRERYDTLDGDRLHWHKRETELANSFIELEDQYERTITELRRMKQRMAAVQAAPVQTVKPAAVFAAVLIDCTSSVIDKDLIKQGADGGKQLGESILAAVTPREEGLVIAQIFLNFPELRKKLISSGVIKKEPDLHDFLDGFRAVSGLFTVIDTDMPHLKVQDHLKLYKLLGATKIVLSSRSSTVYREVIKPLSSADKHEIYAVRGGGAPDPFDFLGAEKLLSISGLMGTGSMPPAPPSMQLDETPRAIPTPTPRPTTPSTVAPAPNPPTHRLQTPPHMRSGSTSSMTGFKGPLSPASHSHRTPVPPTASTELPPAPWAPAAQPDPPRTRPAVKPAPVAANKAGIPWWEAGDTLNDKAQSAASSSPSISTRSEMSISPPGTPRAEPRQRTSSGQPKSSRNGLTVPVRSLASLAGSPPDSDEDHPNVDLPHSAVKWVQRPIEFGQDSQAGSQSGSRSRSNSISSSSMGGGSARNGPSGRAGGAAGIHPQRAFALAQQGLLHQAHGSASRPAAVANGASRPSTSPRTASKTGSNDIPLGSRAGGGTVGKLHGFSVRK